MIPRPGCNFRIFQKSSKYIDLMHIRHQKSNETGEKMVRQNWASVDLMKIKFNLVTLNMLVT